MKPKIKTILPCVLLPLVLLLTACGERLLQSGLTQADAQRIVVLLTERGIEASLLPEAAKSDGPATFTVQVRGGQEVVVSAWRVLQENGIPQTSVRGLGEVFGQPSMIPTAAEERARLLIGLSGELTRTLKSISGVVDARVHVVLPENSPLVDRKDWKPATASVLIQHLPPQPPIAKEDVQKIVSLGVEGLEADNVAIVFTPVTINHTPIPPRWRPQADGLVLAWMGIAGLAVVLCLFLGWQSRQLRTRLAALEGSKGAAA
jgi:type III secretion protein J